MRVLLVVDMQNDFCPGGALPVGGGHEIVGVINELMRSGGFDVVIATKDYHPSDHVSFVDNHPEAKCFQTIETAKGPQIMWPRHCQRGTRGAEFHESLDTTLLQHTVLKGLDSIVDSYSGFYDNARERETPLRGLLESLTRERGETLRDVKVSVCGLALDYCVSATAVDAASLGMETEVIVDACRAVDPSPERFSQLEREFATARVGVTLSAQLLPTRPRDVLQEYGQEQKRGFERGLPC